MKAKTLVTLLSISLAAAGCSDAPSEEKHDHGEAASPSTPGGGTNVGAGKTDGSAKPDAGSPPVVIEPNFLIEQDGKLLLGGPGGTDPTSDPSLPATNQQDMMLERYGTDGKIDRSFGTNGYAVLDFMGLPQERGMLVTDAAISAHIAPDGAILVAGFGGGSSFGGFSSFAALARLLPDGKPDPAFGTGGRLLWRPDGADTLAQHMFRAVTTDAQGRIYAAGDDGEDDWVLRFSADGKIDTTFGGGALVEADGKALGLFVTDQRIIHVERGYDASAFTFDGALDTSFGEEGYFDGGDGVASAVEQLPDGTIVMVGVNKSEEGSKGEFICKIVAISPAGTPAAYGSEGVVEIVIPTNTTIEVRGVSVAADLSVLIYYAEFGMPGLLRVTPNGALDTSFGMRKFDFSTTVVDLSENRDQLFVLGHTAWIADSHAPNGPLIESAL